MTGASPELHLDRMPCALHEMRNVWVSKTALVEDMHLVFVNGMQSLNGISRAVHPHAVTDAASYRRADRAASELKMLIAAARRLTGK